MSSVVKGGVVKGGVVKGGAVIMVPGGEPDRVGVGVSAGVTGEDGAVGKLVGEGMMEERREDAVAVTG